MKSVWLFVVVMVAVCNGLANDVSLNAVSDRIISDDNGDGQGSSLWAEAFAFDAAGDSGGNADLRTVIRFDLSAVKSEILAANHILFRIQVETAIGAPSDWQVIYLTEGNDGTAAVSDYQAAGDPVGAAQSGPLAADTWVEFDVTELVQADADVGGWSVFRVQSVTGTDGDGVADQIRFYTTEDGGGDGPHLLIGAVGRKLTLCVLH